MSQLEKDVAAANKVIASLGSEGKNLLAAIERTGASLRAIAPSARYGAAYIIGDNEFRMPENVSLHQMFNYEVHEGVHGCQFTAIPDFTASIQNLWSLYQAPERNAAGLAIPAPESLLLVKDLAEAKAHTVQANFNLAAARRYADERYITCLDPEEYPEGFIELQKHALATGREIAGFAREMALSYLDMKYRNDVSYQDILHAMNLDSYIDVVLGCPDKTLEKLNIYEISPLETARLLEAGGTFGFEKELLAKFGLPRLALENAKRLIDIRECLGPR